MVKIIDDFGGNTEYQIPTSIIVEMKSSLLTPLMSQMSDMSSGSSMVQKMFSGNPQIIMQNVNSFASMLNTMAASSSGESSKFDFGPSSLGASFSFENLTQLRSQYQTNTTVTLDEGDRNMRATVRANMMSFVSEMSLSDMTSIRMQSSILSMLTQTTAEVDRTSSVYLYNLLIGVLAYF